MEKKYEHISQQERMQALWKAANCYAFNPQAPDKIFSIDTPPPTVSGNLHIGHIFSYTHTDIIARYKRMRGYNIFYPMGFDDNGLATERFVEKKLGVRASAMKRSEFIELCLKASHEVEIQFETLWRKLGLSIDWSHTYSTIESKARKISQYSFIDLYKKGLIYRMEEPALYCTSCRTSVAQAEVEGVEHSSTFNTLIFTTPSGEKLLIATTRPELLPACVALFYHPEDMRYKHLAKTQAITPLFNQSVPILPDEAVNPDKGTGLVMCCTFGDQTDILWYKKHKLPFIQAVGFDGTWTQKTGILQGLRVHEARKKVLTLLQEEGKLVEQKNIVHQVSTHERCKQEIEYLILSQWFVRILDQKKAFLELADKIKWTPEFMKSRYRDWVENLGWDWCISRQRFYGVPFPVWHCNDCKEILLAQPQSLPIDPQEHPYPGGTCSTCGSSHLTPETDVMDTWNTSSLTPHINTQWPDNNSPVTIPMSMRPQAHDIIRTWAFDTIVKTYYHQQTIPWQDIVISGHVLSGKDKISKSQGGAKLTPEYLFETYPADAIRYWAAQGKPGTDISFNETQLKIGLRLITKLWNAFLFCQTHIDHLSLTPSISINDPLNKWILYHFEKTRRMYTHYFDSYDYHLALEVSEKFFWHYFCDNYIELVKDQLFNPTKYDQATVASTKATLHKIGYGILQLFAPYVPYITESLYQDIYKEHMQHTSLHTTLLTELPSTEGFAADVLLTDVLVDIVTQVRKAKSDAKLSLVTPVNTLFVYSQNHQLLQAIKAHQTLLCGITKAHTVQCVDQELDKATITSDGTLLEIKVKAYVHGYDKEQTT